MKNFPAGYEVKDIAASSKSDTDSILILVLLTTHCMILNKPKGGKKEEKSEKYSEDHSSHVWKGK